MSYIRYNSELKYMKGESDDYVYPAETADGTKYIEDYGDITNKGLAEIICRFIDTDNRLEDFEKQYFIKKLCERLGEAGKTID